MRSIKSCEIGSITLTAVLAPVLIFSLLLALFAYKVMKIKGQHQHLCQKEQLLAQKSQAQLLRQLLNLNKPAVALRAEKKAAIAARNAARIHPVALAAAEAALQIVRTKQRLLRMKQRAIISSSKVIWARARALSRAKRGRIVPRWFSPGRMPVTKIADIWGSPTYKPSSKLTREQQSFLGWKFKLDIISPAVVNLLGSRSLDFHIACSATLKKRGTKWVPVLRPANRLSSFA